MDINRRRFMAHSSAVLVGGVALLAAPTIASANGEGLHANGLPKGFRRGRVTEIENDGTKIYEVINQEGAVVGYTLDDAKLSRLAVVGEELRKEDARLGGSVQARSVSDVATCAGAIAGFVALTVFPVGRAAQLAWRLGKLVAKYGPQVVARIFKGARNISGRTAQQEILEIMKELAGIGALKACGL